MCFSPLSDIIFHVTSINAFFTNFFFSFFFYYFRHSIVRQLTDDGSHHLPAHVPEKFHSQENVKANNKLTKQTTIGDLENIHLNPKVEGRIRVLTGRVSFKLLANTGCFIWKIEISNGCNFVTVHIWPYVGKAKMRLRGGRFFEKL